jgi:hypothetical protein
VFRLAALLGKTVSELNITWREFLHWQAYLKMEPVDAGDNARTASLMACITNMSGKVVKKAVSPSDFLPKKPQTPEQQKAFFKSLTRTK